MSIIHQAATTAAQAGSSLHVMTAGIDGGSVGFRDDGLFTFGDIQPRPFRDEAFVRMFTSDLAGPNNALIIAMAGIGIAQNYWSSIRFITGTNWAGLVRFQTDAQWSPDVINHTQWVFSPPATDPPFVSGQVYEFVMSF